MVGGLAQVRRAGIRPELGPERVDDLVPGRPAAVGQSEQGHQLGGTTHRPVVRAQPHLPR
jgi:hypothetical protein